MQISPEFEQDLAEAVAIGQKDLVSFRRVWLPSGLDEVEAAPFHFDWSKSLLHGTENEAIEGFRESAKGQICLRAFLLYRLRHPIRRQSYIVLIKANATQAEAKLQETIEEYIQDEILSSNLVNVRRKAGKVFDVDVMDSDGEVINVRIEAYGKGASVRGLSNKERRPDIVLIDDPQDKEDADSDVTLQKDWEWFMADIFFLGKHCRIFLIGNNLGEKCIIERVGVHQEQLGFNFRRIPSMVEEDGKPPRSSWPAQFSVEFLLKEKEAFRSAGQLETWMRERQCLAVSPETQLFPKSYFQYYNSGILPSLRQSCNGYLTIDPAYSDKDTSCYRALVVTLVDEMDNWFIAEISYGVYDPDKLIDEMFRLAVVWELSDVHIEEGFAKVLEPFIVKEMSKRKRFFSINYLKHKKKSKMQRIRLLQPRYKAKKIFHPTEAWWLSELETELCSLTIYGSKGMRIDVVDTLAYVDQIAEKPMITSHSKTRNMIDLPRQHTESNKHPRYLEDLYKSRVPSSMANLPRSSH